ncbi:MAG: hypothetical protein JO011_12155 [Ktedonobacteraceae bacterium]|nr:hypothetical protein [Ktedonobacteraceae bacterium]
MPYSGGSATGQMNLDRVESGLTALIERGGWWAQRACKLRPYTIGNCGHEGGQSSTPNGRRDSGK